MLCKLEIKHSGRNSARHTGHSIPKDTMEHLCRRHWLPTPAGVGELGFGGCFLTDNLCSAGSNFKLFVSQLHAAFGLCSVDYCPHLK